MKYYLAHHGKQGQHWGVRHGPPYPLDSNASKQAKRKRKSISDYEKIYGEKSIIARKNILINKQKNKTITIDELRELNNILSAQNTNTAITKKNIIKNTLKDTSSILKDSFTIAITAYKINKNIQPIIKSLHDKYSGKLDQSIDRIDRDGTLYFNKVIKRNAIKYTLNRKNIDKEKHKEINLNKKYPKLKDIPETYKQKIADINNINKISYKNGKKNAETTYNCVNCSMAYILRQCGYNVKAKPFSDNSVKYGTGFIDELDAFTMNRNNISSSKHLEKDIEKILNKNKTSHALLCTLNHCIVAEKTDSTIRLIDCQNPDSIVNKDSGKFVIKKLEKTSDIPITICPIDINNLKNTGQSCEYIKRFIDPVIYM